MIPAVAGRENARKPKPLGIFLLAKVIAGARSDRLHMAWIPLVVRMQFSS